MCARRLVFLLAALPLWGQAALDVSTKSFTFGVTPGGSALPKNFQVVNRGSGDLHPTIQIPKELTWLRVNLAGSQGSVEITSAGLAEGIYDGTFSISDPAAADSPQQIRVKLYVTRTVVPDPVRLDFVLAPNQSATKYFLLPVQSVASGNLPGTKVSTQSGGNWLTLEPRVDAGFWFRVTASSALAAGTYTGSVAFDFRGQAVGQLPVTLTVTSQPIVSVDRTSMALETSPGLEVPEQYLQVSGGTNLAVTSDALWVVPKIANGLLTLSFATTQFAAGTYRASVTVGTLSIPITLTISNWDAPVPKIGGVVDAGNYCSRPNCYLAPGSIATIFGSQLAGPAFSAASLPLPEKLDGTRVLVNGAPAGLFYVAYGQINFRLPDTLPASGRWFIVVERDHITGAAVTARATTRAPAIFTLDGSGAGYGAVLLTGTAQAADAGHPARRGDFVEIYCTGLGGASSRKPTVLFYGAGITGNVEAEVDYAGPAGAFAGLDQINVRIPASLPVSSNVRMQIRTPENLLSNAVSIAVR